MLASMAERKQTRTYGAKLLIISEKFVAHSWKFALKRVLMRSCELTAHRGRSHLKPTHNKIPLKIKQLQNTVN